MGGSLFFSGISGGISMSYFLVGIAGITGTFIFFITMLPFAYVLLSRFTGQLHKIIADS
jgi:hypothetical protein